MNDDPVIVVHGKDHAIAALNAAVRHEIAVLLLSQQGGVSVWGAEGFKAVMEIAADAVPDAGFRWAIDCDDDPGWALSAIRAGVSGIVFDPGSPAFERIADIAQQANVTVVSPKTYDGPLLDLSLVGDPATACDTFLLRGAIHG